MLWLTIDAGNNMGLVVTLLDECNIRGVLRNQAGGYVECTVEQHSDLTRAMAELTSLVVDGSIAFVELYRTGEHYGLLE